MVATRRGTGAATQAAAPEEHSGPFFVACATLSAAELAASGEDVTRRPLPVLVKGAVAHWPAAELWSFQHLASVCGSTPASFYDGGPAEQGVTRAPLILPVGPYLARLGQASAAASSCAPDPALRLLEPHGRGFALNWSFRPQANALYLAQWSVLDHFPRLRRDIRVKALWGGWRLCWEHVFLGPAGTVTGLHYDWNANCFLGLRGVKDWLLFPADQGAHLQPSDKFDWGATCSRVDLSRLSTMPADVRARFQGARGLYARVEPGDALYVPPGCWHAVVAQTPCVSLSVFGLTLWQVLTKGLLMTLLAWLHAAGLWRKGNCTCCRNTGHTAKRD